MSSSDALVSDYLARLDRAAQSLPPERRSELLEGIGEHIAAARATGAAADDAALRTVLDRLGQPEEIVAAARDDVLREARPSPLAAPTSTRGTGLELAAVLLLTAGSFFPVVGWLVGVGLLWASSLWRVREKLLGTLVVPLGPGGFLLWGAIVPGGTCTTSTQTFPDGTVELTAESCEGFVLSLPLSILAIAVVLVAPVVVAVLLMRIARRRAAV